MLIIIILCLFQLIVLVNLPKESYKSDKTIVCISVLAYLTVILYTIFPKAPNGGYYVWDFFILIGLVGWMMKRWFTIPLISHTQFEFEVVYRVILLVAFWYYLIVRDVVIGYTVPSLKKILFTILVATGTVGLCLLLSYAMNFLKISWRKVSSKEVLIITGYMLLFVGLSQEVLYRGLLLGYIMYFSHNLWAALLASSAIFGLAHLRFAGWKMACIATLAGCGYGLIYILTDSIYCAIIAHTATNLFWKLFMRRNDN